MNQSDWFSIEDLNLVENISNNQNNNNNISDKKSLTKMETILQQYKEIILENNLFKYQVKQSTNQNNKQVNEKSRIKIKCEEKDDNGQILNQQQSQNAIKISMSSSIPQIIGFRKALLSMKEGDQAWFKISNEQLQLPNEIENAPTIQTKYFLIQLEEVMETQQSIDVTNLENRAIQLEKFKSEGNKLFKNGDFIGASSRYQRGLNFIEKWPKNLASDKQAELLKQEYFLVLVSNKAQALINLQNYEEVVKILEPIIDKFDQNPYKIKCYYRLIHSLIQISNYKQALKFVEVIKTQLTNPSEIQFFQEQENICLKEI